jgi:hypothetical protein
MNKKVSYGIISLSFGVISLILAIYLSSFEMNGSGLLGLVALPVYFVAFSVAVFGVISGIAGIFSKPVVNALLGLILNIITIIMLLRQG